MQSIRAGFAAAMLAAAGVVATAGSADARNWVAVGWVEIPVRAYPSTAAPVVTTINGGSRLSLTGQCTRELDLGTIAYMRPVQQRALVSTRWCELSGPAHGWVFGGFMKPF